MLVVSLSADCSAIEKILICYQDLSLSSFHDLMLIWCIELNLEKVSIAELSRSLIEYKSSDSFVFSPIRYLSKCL